MGHPYFAKMQLHNYISIRGRRNGFHDSACLKWVTSRNTRGQQIPSALHSKGDLGVACQYRREGINALNFAFSGVQELVYAHRYERVCFSHFIRQLRVEAV